MHWHFEWIVEKTVEEDAGLICGRTQESYVESRYFWDKCRGNNRGLFCHFEVRSLPFAHMPSQSYFSSSLCAFCLLCCSLDDRALTYFCFSKIKKILLRKEVLTPFFPTVYKSNVSFRASPSTRLGKWSNSWDLPGL